MARMAKFVIKKDKLFRFLGLPENADLYSIFPEDSQQGTNNFEVYISHPDLPDVDLWSSRDVPTVDTFTLER